ncbi:YhcN/YlaJ family sporulation lipoprotein [Aquibacillus sediminis]|uniref:YhcN/YlaJ family sporulation lipoprotein n=1 Tax=Aquibacillus sediminis TaxID=2574734 RepID=UPI00148654A1|nr:YhcN/YlaJ family sporulation lipoprotein [Aquibacillus sediminis]
MKKFVMYCMVMLVCAVQFGCNTEENQTQPENIEETRNMSYHKGSEQSDQPNDDQEYSHAKSRDQALDGYLTGMGDPDKESSRYTEGFYNEDTIKVMEEVNKFDEVDVTQALVSDDTVYISPMLNQKEYSVDTESILSDIHTRIKQMYPDKKVIVESDGIFWNKMRDLDARLQDAEDPKHARDIINEFSNNNR